MIRSLALAGLLCPLGGAPAAALEPPDISFRVDARLELLSAAVGLAAREGLAPGWEGEPYARDARGHFGAWASHPLVGGLRRIIEADPQGDSKLQGFMLHLSSPPQLALRASLPEDLVEGLGGEKALEDLLSDLRDFARRTEFGRFFESHASDHERLAAAARREALQAQSPSSVAAYLGSPGPGRTFLLAVLMPPSRARAAALHGLPEDGEPRLRPARRFEGGVPVFGLDVLDASPAHELARSALGDDELALAVTLRALALDLGEAVYSEKLRGYEARYPYLAALGQALKAHETQGRGRLGLRELKAVLRAAVLEGLPRPAPSPVPPKDDPKFGRDKALGVQAFLDKDFKAALEHLRRAQARAPRDLEAQLNLGVVYSELGEAGLALAWYGRVISAKPASPAEETLLLEALSSRASLLEALRRPQEARADLERALDLAPADWARRGETLARLRRLAR